MADLNTARKSLLRLLSLYPVPAGSTRPCEVRNHLLDIEAYLDTLPGITTPLQPYQRAAINALRELASGVTDDVSGSNPTTALVDEYAAFGNADIPRVNSFPPMAEAFVTACNGPLVESTAPKLPAGFRMTDKAMFDYAAYRSTGHTLQSLLETGIVVAV